ncbi:hypothetical protein Esi_0049_0131 [Ectocarpus siliculosus]|uniref:Uncharacterized protein n=1 Tax=Ectocarpus siliculosus TaxID=2880 RepID=D7G309_ECTSI|nr:hypothetical protein Esi_0049_0131 [Ectocarpus siliculosus]|eukprot:CBJ48866.1 hypothetical protein Esi_0049_0131 [Ectocarpus siliculosus]
MFSGDPKGPLEEINEHARREAVIARRTGGQQQAVMISKAAAHNCEASSMWCLKWNLGTKNAMRRCRWPGGTVDSVPGPPKKNSRADAATQLRILRLVRQLNDPGARLTWKQFIEVKEWRRLQPSLRPFRVQAGTSAGRERGRQRLTLQWERGTTATPTTRVRVRT